MKELKHGKNVYEKGSKNLGHNFIRYIHYSWNKYVKMNFNIFERTLHWFWINIPTVLEKFKTNLCLRQYFYLLINLLPDHLQKKVQPGF